MCLLGKTPSAPSEFTSCWCGGESIRVRKWIWTWTCEHVDHSLGEELKFDVCISERRAGTKDRVDVALDAGFKLAP